VAALTDCAKSTDLASGDDLQRQADGGQYGFAFAGLQDRQSGLDKRQLSCRKVGQQRIHFAGARLAFLSEGGTAAAAPDPSARKWTAQGGEKPVERPTHQINQRIRIGQRRGDRLGTEQGFPPLQYGGTQSLQGAQQVVVHLWLKMPEERRSRSAWFG